MTNFKIKDMKNKNMKHNLHFPPSKGSSKLPNKIKTESKQSRMVEDWRRNIRSTGGRDGGPGLLRGTGPGAWGNGRAGGHGGAGRAGGHGRAGPGEAGVT